MSKQDKVNDTGTSDFCGCPSIRCGIPAKIVIELRMADGTGDVKRMSIRPLADSNSTYHLCSSCHLKELIDDLAHDYEATEESL